MRCPHCNSIVKQLTGTLDFICNDRAHWIPGTPDIEIVRPKVTSGFHPNSGMSAEIRAEILAKWDRIYRLKSDGFSYENILNDVHLDISACTLGKHFRTICRYKGIEIEPRTGRYAVTGKPRRRTRSDGKSFGRGVNKEAGA